MVLSCFYPFKLDFKEAGCTGSGAQYSVDVATHDEHLAPLICIYTILYDIKPLSTAWYVLQACKAGMHARTCACQIQSDLAIGQQAKQHTNKLLDADCKAEQSQLQTVVFPQ